MFSFALLPAAKMSWFTTNVIATLLLPPLSLLLLLALGIILLLRRSKYSKPVLLIATTLLWLASTPYCAEGARHWLEARTTALGSNPPQADAIVILGGGAYFRAPEYGGKDTVTEETLARLRYGASLQHATGKPLLVTGGKPVGGEISEAALMRASLEQDFHVPVQWTEEQANNTYENAFNSYRVLHQVGIRKIYLVTHAWHMPRAAAIFRKAGFEVVEAPMGFSTRYRIDLLAFLPRAESLLDSKIVVHELIGLVWYRLKSLVIN
jgi:uncharacterized SAM-binding protein YcdF (DUF218 family)